MSGWNHPEQWEAYCREETCPVCSGQGPSYILNVAPLRASRLIAHDRVALKGYCCLVVQRHAVEMYDLSPADAAAFMQDIQTVSRALRRVTGAVKINYEIHGNTIPHLHMHFFPRHIGDRFEGMPIDWRLVEPPVYQPGEFQEFVAKLRESLIDIRSGGIL